MYSGHKSDQKHQRCLPSGLPVSENIRLTGSKSIQTSQDTSAFPSQRYFRMYNTEKHLYSLSPALVVYWTLQNSSFLVQNCILSFPWNNAFMASKYPWCNSKLVLTFSPECSNHTSISRKQRKPHIQKAPPQADASEWSVLFPVVYWHTSWKQMSSLGQFWLIEVVKRITIQTSLLPMPNIVALFTCSLASWTTVVVVQHGSV